MLNGPVQEDVKILGKDDGILQQKWLLFNKNKPNVATFPTESINKSMHDQEIIANKQKNAKSEEKAMNKAENIISVQPVENLEEENVEKIDSLKEQKAEQVNLTGGMNEMKQMKS